MYPLPGLHTERTCIRLPKEADVPLLWRHRTGNREHFAPWEPRRDEAYFTEAACGRAIVDGLRAARDDRAYPLLARLGFEREGYARSYLCIDGRWQDHVLTALVNPRHREPVCAD